MASSPVNLKGCSYTVSIDWGDGSAPSNGKVVVGKDGTIHVKGSHLFWPEVGNVHGGIN